MKTIKIRNKTIGENHSVFIIAEAGVNHNGDFELAKKLIDAAKESGADAVKFQTFKTENVVTKHASMAEYQEKNIGKKETMQEMIKKLEISYDDFKKLKNYCDEKGIMFLSTPHSDDAIDFLDPLMPAFKVSSSDLTNFPFLEKIAQKGKPIILSTGMATMKEIVEAVDLIKKAGNDKIILLHCTSNYPCELKDVNLRAMQTLREKTNLLVGYSDHTLGLETSKLAANLGAVVIERHFTIDKNLPGPDHKASLSPEELKELVNAIRNKDYDIPEEKKEIILGSAEKKPTEKEISIAQLVRKSIVAKLDIPNGTIITKDMLIIKRPGTGIPSKYINEVIGKKAKIFIKQLGSLPVPKGLKELKGQCACKGEARGRAKIIKNKEDYQKFKPNDILISYATNPNMVPLMKKSSAIITDEGGVTCHAAIVSRELGIPCIIGTRFATKIIKDNDQVEVNATKGVVKILKKK